MTNRRPVVAILDTGCGEHPWFKGGVVTPGPLKDKAAVGVVDPATDPETKPDQKGYLDGGIDDVSGHGTFICGLIHQACPDANILAWRVVGSDGSIIESELTQALKDIAELARRYRDGEQGGQAIDVLNLSMGYYHESAEDIAYDPTMYASLKLLGDCGVVVTCSAGNDAGYAPMFPAAFAPWSDQKGPYQISTSTVPVVSVAAVNPNGTDALFTNVGPWVRARDYGGAVISASPPFQGGYMPSARTIADGRTRETIDPDDYTGHYAVWSGTSFSSPLMAGRLAAALGPIPTAQKADGRAAAVQRGWAAVKKLTDIK